MQKETKERSTKVNIADLPETNDLTQKNEKVFEFEPKDDELDIRETLDKAGVKIVGTDTIEPNFVEDAANSLLPKKFQFDLEKIEKMVISKIDEDEFDLFVLLKNGQAYNFGLGKKNKSILYDVPPEILIAKV